MNDTLIKNPCHIVIVGGGAAGIELAIRFSKLVQKLPYVKVTLIDKSLRHLWKPLYHEVAVGTLNMQDAEAHYFELAYRYNFNFIFGTLLDIDRNNKQAILADASAEENLAAVPQHYINYDYLVIAIGSVSNTYNIPGVAEHCIFLDTLSQAEQARKYLFNKIIFFIQNNKLIDKSLSIVIIGGGATGVELAAEILYALTELFKYFKFSLAYKKNIKITILESADNILNNLPPNVIKKITNQLTSMSIKVLTNQRVTRVDSQHVITQNHNLIPAHIKIWAAGIKAPEVLTKIAGLEKSASGQLIVKQNLLTTIDDYIFAIGDCARCPQPEPIKWVPPRAQAAHQQAKILAISLYKHLQGKPLIDYVYRDYGSLIALSRYNVVGILMGKVIGSFFIEGYLARFGYALLFKVHQVLLFGLWKVVILNISQFLVRNIKSKLQLH